jgi:GTPase SAR1 family protein
MRSMCMCMNKMYTYIHSSQAESISLARRELHQLLEDSSLATMPLLICANKVDLQPHMSEKEVITTLFHRNTYPYIYLYMP